MPADDKPTCPTCGSDTPFLIDAEPGTASAEIPSGIPCSNTWHDKPTVGLIPCMNDDCNESHILAHEGEQPTCPHNCFIGPDGGHWTKDGPCPRQRIHDKEDFG